MRFLGYALASVLGLAAGVAAVAVHRSPLGLLLGTGTAVVVTWTLRQWLPRSASAFAAGWPPTRTSGDTPWAASRTPSSVVSPSLEPLSGIGIASTSAVPLRFQSLPSGATAPWIAGHVQTPYGRRRAIIFNLFGMADLVVAVGLGIMTSPGPLQIFQTAPTSELATHFPLVLVPAFLVPLAFTLHVVSLWQLLGGTWAAHRPSSNSIPE